MITISVDLMGGDHAPEEILKGCLEFAEMRPDVRLELCADQRISGSVSVAGHSNIGLKFFPHTVEMTDPPSIIKKEKTDSTVAGAVKLIKSKNADCAFCCGNSGAAILSSIGTLGLKEGHIHPALMTLIPMYDREPLAVTDVGAGGNYGFNADIMSRTACEAENTYRALFRAEKPSVSLLNIGKAAWKGTPEHKKMFSLLTESGMDFKGNIEGDEILRTTVNIILTDGFTGNVILKILESFNDIISGFKNIKDCKITDNYLNFLLNDFRYDAIGGAPLLGINGKVVIGHGKSDCEAVKNGLELCARYSEI